MKPFSYLVATEIVFGPGCLDTLEESARGLGKKALVVTGKRSARASGSLDRALAQLPGAVVFDGAEENPTTDTCERGAEVCRRNGCDFVVGLGGGSAMDTAKAVAGLALNPGPCAKYFGRDQFTNGALPIVAIPTTAGTGSEVTPYSVILDAEARTKKTIAGRCLFPAVALVDPELSVTMPRHMTASTGLDALSQAMEGLVSRRSTPLGDVLALEACRVIEEWLPRAVAEPTDLEARSRMLYAAMLSGCVISQSGTTIVHGMGYYFTIEFGLAHGLANALLLTPLFQYNAAHEPEKVAAIATALGYPAAPTPGDAHDKIAAAIHGLLREVGVSPAAKDAGVERERLPWCAQQFFADTARFKNQPGQLTEEHILKFFEAAYEGRFD